MSKDDFTKFAFPIVRKEPIPDPYYGERCCYEPGICMRAACGLARKDNSVLCEEHTQEVLDKKAKAPPLIPYNISRMPGPNPYPNPGVFYIDYAYTKEPEEK